jgi:Zn-dependent protease with chaperone function
MKPRLNPFIFPTDTDFRFIILIVSFLGASLFIFKLLYFSFDGRSSSYVTTQLECMNLKGTYNFSDLDNYRNPEYLAAHEAYNSCRAPSEQAVAIWSLGGLLFLIAVSGMIFWTFPARIVHKKKLTLLTDDDAPEVVKYLQGLCHEVGIFRTPGLYWNPLDSSITGLAFGRRGDYKIALSGGLITRYYVDRPGFRAIVLHELAHIYNADIDKTYVTQSLWQAFLLLAVPSFIITSLINTNQSGPDWTTLFGLSWRLMGLVLLVYLLRNGVLRIREIYADVRASTWDQTKEEILKVLASLPNPEVPRWRKVMFVHPDPSIRSGTVKDTGRLFPLSFWDVCGVGVASSVAFPGVSLLLKSFLIGSDLDFYTSIFTSLIFAPLAMGVVGTGIWRMTFAERLRAERHRGVGQLGLGLTLGIVIGHFISFESFNNLKLYQDLELLFIGGYALWTVLLLLSVLFVVWWIRVSSSAWVIILSKVRSPKIPVVIGLFIAGIMFALLVGILFYFSDPIIFIGMLNVRVVFIVLHPLAWVFSSFLWLFPISSWFWRKKVQSSEINKDLFLEESIRPIALAEEYFPHPGTAGIAGLVTAFIYTLFLLVVRIFLRQVFPDAVRETEQFLNAFLIGTVGMAVIMQAGIAFLITLWTTRSGPIYGLFGAFSASIFMSIGILGLNILFGGGIATFFAWMIFSYVTNIGVVVTIPTVVFASVLATLFRGLYNKIFNPAEEVAYQGT